MLRDLEPQQVERALDGDRQAMDALVARLLPVIEAAVTSSLRRAAASEARDLDQETRDFVHDVLISLLAHRGRALRAWDPSRGRSFDSFVRLIAQRRVCSCLRSRRQNPWTERPVASDEIERRLFDTRTPAEALESSDALAIVLDRLDRQLGERGMSLFTMLYVHECSVGEVVDATDMSRDAVYAWRLRFRKFVATLPPLLAQ